MLPRYYAEGLLLCLLIRFSLTLLATPLLPYALLMPLRWFFAVTLALLLLLMPLAITLLITLRYMPMPPYVNAAAIFAADVVSLLLLPRLLLLMPAILLTAFAAIRHYAITTDAADVAAAMPLFTPLICLCYAIRHLLFDACCWLFRYFSPLSLAACRFRYILLLMLSPLSPLIIADAPLRHAVAAHAIQYNTSSFTPLHYAMLMLPLLLLLTLLLYRHTILCLMVFHAFFATPRCYRLRLRAYFSPLYFAAFLFAFFAATCHPTLLMLLTLLMP